MTCQLFARADGHHCALVVERSKAFQTPAPLVLHEDNINVKACIVDSNSTTERYLVFSVSQDLRLYKLSISSDSAVIEPVGQVPVQQLQVIVSLI